MDDFPIVETMEGDMGDIPLNFPKVILLRGHTDFVDCFTISGTRFNRIPQGYRGPVNYYYEENSLKKIYL